jgi:uncharacterized protein YukE
LFRLWANPLLKKEREKNKMNHLKTKDTMKKILFALMAVIAICLASCNGTAKQGANGEGAEAADATITALTEQLDAAQIDKLQETLASIKEKIAELIKNNPEVAKEYVTKVQNFLKENADKIKEVAGNNATIDTAVSALTSISPEQVVENLSSAIGGAAESVQDAAQQQADQAVDAANQAVDAANQAVDDAKAAAEEAVKQKTEEAKQAAKDKAAEQIDAAADQVKKGLGL